MTDFEERRAYAASCVEEAKQLIRDLCAIPAPSGDEDARAAFCAEWMKKNLGGEVCVDEAKNAVCRIGDTGSNELIVFAAHTDTVFPDTEPMPFREDAGKFYCPGVLDDTANLSVMLIAARCAVRRFDFGGAGLIVTANSCEEGLGNLKGARRLFKDYGSRVRAFVTFDGTKLPAVVVNAVGSHRYRITARTRGGHSFSDFGSPNAIEKLCGLVEDLYRIEVPREGDSITTYNAGVISGGTSVNTIAQSAEMLFEYRSDNVNCLDRMKEMFEEIIRKNRTDGAVIEVDMIGERPCAANDLPERMKKLIGACSDAVRKVSGEEPSLRSGSTDANIPLSLGIPATCVTAAGGRYVHTREEELDLDSIEIGILQSTEVMRNVLKL